MPLGLHVSHVCLDTLILTVCAKAALNPVCSGNGETVGFADRGGRSTGWRFCTRH